MLQLPMGRRDGIGKLAAALKHRIEVGNSAHHVRHVQRDDSTCRTIQTTAPFSCTVPPGLWPLWCTVGLFTAQRAVVSGHY